jgi:hypothetical protein
MLPRNGELALGTYYGNTAVIIGSYMQFQSGKDPASACESGSVYGGSNLASSTSSGERPDGSPSYEIVTGG